MASRGWRPAWRTALARPEPAHHSVAVGAGRECPRWTLPCQGKPVSIGRIQTQRALFPPRRLASCPRNRHLRPGPEHRLFLRRLAYFAFPVFYLLRKAGVRPIAFYILFHPLP